MKKLLSVLLALVLVLSAFTLVSCNEKDGDSKKGEETSNDTQTAPDAPTSATNQTLTILGYDFYVSKGLAETAFTEMELKHMSVYVDSATGAKLTVSGTVEPGITDEEIKEMYPQDAEAAKAATAVSYMYTYSDYVYETASYGIKFSYKVDKGMDEITYNTAYYFIEGETIIIFAFEEKDAARPCGESFAVLDA